MPGKRMTDNELRRKLIELGIDVGPITDSTRKLYEKKLDQLVNGSPQDKKNRRRSAPLQPVQKVTSQSSLIGFSSEESELDLGDSDSRRRRRRTMPPTYVLSPESNPTPSTSFTLPEFKVPFPKFSQNYGILPNSDFKRTTLRSSKRLSLNNISAEQDSSDSDFDVDKRLSKSKGRRSLGAAPRSSTSGAKSFEPPSALSVNVKNRHSVVSSNATTTTKSSLQVNGQRKLASDPDEAFQWDFVSDDEDSDSSSKWQHVPHLLLAVVAAFFAIIGLLYLGVRQNDPRSAALANYGFSEFTCRSFMTEECVPKENLHLALLATRHLHSILSERAGQFECDAHKYPKKSLTFQEAKRTLFDIQDVKDESIADEVFENCIFLMKKHPDWGLIVLEDETGEGRALESQIARKGLWCRLQQAFNRVFQQLCLSLTVIVGAYGCFLFVNHRRQKKRIFEKQLFELIEKIIETVQHHQETSNLEKDSFLPVVHVRDMLIPLVERNNAHMIKLWDTAVSFLDGSESRIRTETKRLAGEDFLVWRWLQPTSPYPSSGSSTHSAVGDNDGRRSKVWQGQAFGTSGKGGNVLPFCPTPCLKIRNMFDPEVEFGTDWPHYIRDAILEKCENNNGILHIHVDATSKEGCVFVKCHSQEAAGQAYRTLHGWWFDGNLVTVKYLRLERYHERFPDARNSHVSLKPSNDLRLSLRPPHNS